MIAPVPPGQHLGPLPDDPDVQIEIERMNALGWDTVSSTAYDTMLAAGIEPDVWRLAA